MPVADFTPEFKRTADNDFDRLKLKLNEKARIVLLEKPTFAWTHTLRAPKIVNGQAVKVEKKRGGETIMDYDLDFVGRPLCHGDEGVLADDAIDPKNCPICKRAKESDEVAPPERRFAVNVIRYGLQRDGITISDPFTCTCVVWAFPESTYNKLYGIAMEYKNRGGLIGLDLILGPCQSPEAYQKFDIMAGSEVIWKYDEFQPTVLKTFQNNRVENLENACGRKTEMRWVNADLDKIREKWAVAHGGPANDTPDEADLGTGLSELLNTKPKTEPVKAALRQPKPELELPQDGQSEPVADKSTGGETSNFQSLLASLNIDTAKR